MLRSVLFCSALSITGLLFAAGCAISPARAKDQSTSMSPRGDGIEEAFLPVPREMFERDFPQGGLYRIPDDPRVAPLVKRALAYEESKQWKAAVNAYTLAYERAGKGTAAPYILFKRCVLDDDLDRSIAGLKELLQTFPSFPRIDAARLELAGRLSHRKQYETALGVLGGVGGAFAPYAAALSGELNFKLGRYKQSLDSYERARGGLAESASPFNGLFLVRCYLGISKTLIARGDDLAQETARELLIRIAGTPSHPYFQTEALALMKIVARAGEEPAPAVAPDEGLLIGSHRFGPDGNFRIAEWPHETPRDGAAAGNEPGGYAVQVGSFGVRGNAENMAMEIKGKGFPGFLSEAAAEGGPLFRVRVGPFADLAEAQEAKRRLGDLGYSGFIVRER
jgi:tetratricopeptide (TPR) repeat protein